MIEHFALKLCDAYHKLCSHSFAVFLREKEDRPKPIQDRALSQGYKSHIAQQALIPIIEELDRQKLDELSGKAKSLYGRVTSSWRTWTAENLYDALKDFRGEISKELAKHKFVRLQSPNDEYFDKEQLFGIEVYEKCKEAREEIKDAGNCIAAELYTACVFHLMRVTEHGFRIVARRLRAAIKDKGKRIPLEYGDWNKVITAINKKIDASRVLANGPKKQERLTYYSEAMERCSVMRDVYRNEVSHTRSRYNKNEALGAMSRVKDFMEIVARTAPR